MPPLRLLFVCSMNRWRSPTAERVYARDPRVVARSAGTSAKAVRRVTAEDLARADAVVAMEDEHVARLRRGFPQEMAEADVFVLDVPDDFRFMDPELVEELRAAVDPLIEELLAERR